MKGIIFNIAESFIVENHGEDVFDDIIANCQLETKEPYVGPGTTRITTCLKFCA